MKIAKIVSLIINALISILIISIFQMKKKLKNPNNCNANFQVAYIIGIKI